MFTHLLPKTETLFRVIFSKYAEKHFLKFFQKKCRGKQWELTERSIRQDLSRLRMPNNLIQKTQQIEELCHSGEYWIVKYDFRIAGSKQSAKTSGNRCIFFLDNSKNLCEILLIYDKTGLPKKRSEAQYIKDVLKTEFPEYLKLATPNRMLSSPDALP